MTTKDTDHRALIVATHNAPPVLLTRLELLEAVAEEAAVWWLDHRPLSWTAEMHHDNPEVNVGMHKALALAVANLIAPKAKRASPLSGSVGPPSGPRSSHGPGPMLSSRRIANDHQPARNHNRGARQMNQATDCVKKEPEWQRRMTVLEDVAKEAQRIFAQAVCKADALMGQMPNTTADGCCPPTPQGLSSRLASATDSIRASLVGIEVELNRIDC